MCCTDIPFLGNVHCSCAEIQFLSVTLCLSSCLCTFVQIWNKPKSFTQVWNINILVRQLFLISCLIHSCLSTDSKCNCAAFEFTSHSVWRHLYTYLNQFLTESFHLLSPLCPSPCSLIVSTCRYFWFVLLTNGDLSVCLLSLRRMYMRARRVWWSTWPWSTEMTQPQEQGELSIL